MNTLVVLVASLCLVSSVHGAAYGEACADDSECPELKEVCGTTGEMTGKCTCSDAFVRDTDVNECKVPLDGECTTGDATICVSNTDCTDSKCACKTGYKESNSLCIAVYDSTCTTNDDCTALAHSACTGVPKKCKCAAGYKHETEACVKKVIGDTCTDDADCQAAVTNSICLTAGQTKTCSCDNGYSGAAEATQCTQVYENACEDAAGCTNLKYGICSAQKCACGDTAVLEGVICKLMIDQTCTDADICPMHSTCKTVDASKKCQCDDNYITQDGKCKAVNSGMSAIASLFLLVAALALLLLL